MFGGRRGHRITLPVVFTIVVVSALVGALTAVVIQRYLQLRTSTAQTSESSRIGDFAVTGRIVDSLAEAAPEAAPTITDPVLSAVSAKLTARRTAELEQLVDANEDIVPGDGTSQCPEAFPIKGTGRSGIYHWPGSVNYQQSRPTLCFRTVEAAAKAGFRPANR
jgi:hypothetical protein